MLRKTTAKVIQLLNEISENAVLWSSDRMIIKKIAEFNQDKALNSLTQHIITLTKKFEAFHINSQSLLQLANYGVCEGNHPNHECQAPVQNEEYVNIIEYRNNYPFGSSMAQKHPRFQWSNSNSVENPQRFFNQKQLV